MFPALQGRSRVQWEEVQEQMEARREQLMSEMGLAEEADEAEEEDVKEGTRGKSAATRNARSPARSGKAEDRPQAASRREKTKK